MRGRVGWLAVSLGWSWRWLWRLTVVAAVNLRSLCRKTRQIHGETTTEKAYKDSSRTTKSPVPSCLFGGTLVLFCLPFGSGGAAMLAGAAVAFGEHRIGSGHKHTEKHKPVSAHRVSAHGHSTRQENANQPPKHPQKRTKKKKKKKKKKKGANLRKGDVGTTGKWGRGDGGSGGGAWTGRGGTWVHSTRCVFHL